MELRMKEPHEKGVAICSAPSFALGTVRCPVKRKQGKRWAGYRASKICNRGADAVTTAEGKTTSRNSALSPARPRTLAILLGPRPSLHRLRGAALHWVSHFVRRLHRYYGG